MNRITTKKNQQKIEFSPAELDFIAANWRMPDKAFLAAFEERFGPGLGFGYWRQYKYTNRLIHQEQVSWTPEQVQFLLDNYQTMGNVDIAAHFGWHNNRKKGEKKVWKKMGQMGLVRSEEAIIKLQYTCGWKARQADIQRRKEAGLPGSAIGHMEGVRWQRKDGTWFIKHDGKVKFLARHIWEERHGYIPDGFMVGYYNGDHTDCRWENLCLRTRELNAKTNVAKSSEGLSFNYVAGIMTCGDRETRETIKSQMPMLVRANQQRLLNQRQIKEHEKK